MRVHIAACVIFMRLAGLGGTLGVTLTTEQQGCYQEVQVNDGTFFVFNK